MQKELDLLANETQSGHIMGCHVMMSPVIDVTIARTHARTHARTRTQTHTHTHTHTKHQKWVYFNC